MKTPFASEEQLNQVIHLACSCYNVEKGYYPIQTIIKNGHDSILKSMNVQSLKIWICESKKRNFSNSEFGKKMTHFRDYFLSLERTIEKL